jgi:hypothetical protein
MPRDATGREIPSAAASYSGYKQLPRKASSVLTVLDSVNAICGLAFSLYQDIFPDLAQFLVSAGALYLLSGAESDESTS